MSTKTPEEVALAVSQDLRSHRITHEEVGRRIGKSRTAVSNLLSRKGRFSRATAELFANEFGYSTDFLLFGKGELYKPDTPVLVKSPDSDKWNPDPIVLMLMVDVFDAIIHATKNMNARKAADMFLLGEYDRFREYLDLVTAESGESFKMPDSLVRLVCERARDIRHTAPAILTADELSSK